MLEDLNLDKEAKALENKRRRLFVLHKIYKILVLPVFHIAKATSVVILLLILIFPPLLIYLIISGAICILTGLIPAPKTIYSDSVKQKVMQRIFKKISSTLNYNIYDLNRENITSCDFFDKRFIQNAKYIVGENNIVGSIDGVSIEFTEVKFYKDVVNYSKTVGGCLLSIVLLPVFIIRGLLTETEEDNDLPGFGIVKDELIFYKGLFMSADFKFDVKDEFLVIPKTLLNQRDKFSSKSFGNSISQDKAQSIGLSSEFALFSTNSGDLDSSILLPRVIAAIQNIYIKDNVKPIVSIVGGRLYATIPNKSNYLNFIINQKVKSSNFFMPFLKEFEMFHNAVKAIQD